MSEAFALDSRLATDTVAVIGLPLCDVRLMNDARFPWLVLVPRRVGMVEISDLAGDEQTALWRELMLAGAALRTIGPCDKLNVGALGNIVRQLHLHVVARHRGDAAWPGPVWGHGTAERFAAASMTARIASLRAQRWS